METNGSTNYCVHVGKEKIYGVTHNQLEELHKTIGVFIEREKAPFACQTESYGEHPITIHKSVALYADKDCFFVDYSLYTHETDVQCMSAGQMKRTAVIMLNFLKRFGENGDKQIRWDVADYPPNVNERVYFKIREDKRLPHFKAVPCVMKHISQENDNEAEICYNIDINEMRSGDLSFREFVVLYRELGDFLKKPVEVC